MGGKSYEYYVNLINSGKKIEAIKAYLEEQNCGFKEAKEYIDSLDKKDSVYFSDIDRDGELIKLIQAGKRREAIKVYTESTRFSLKEAKEYDEKVENSSGIPTINSGNMNLQKSGKTKFEGCFIATVCYGGYDIPEVIEFRRFGDDVLLNTTIEEIFVKLYSKYSPDISKVVGKSGTMKIIIRKYFLGKILNYINLLK